MAGTDWGLVAYLALMGCAFLVCLVKTLRSRQHAARLARTCMLLTSIVHMHARQTAEHTHTHSGEGATGDLAATRAQQQRQLQEAMTEADAMLTAEREARIAAARRAGSAQRGQSEPGTALGQVQ